MVLLTMTPAIVQALERLQNQQLSTTFHIYEAQLEPLGAGTPKPSLSEPSIDKPISHDQVIYISKQMKTLGLSPYHLDILLRGSKVYNPPPPPKPKPTPEYQALMSRLRREEEARAYERLTKPPPPGETFASRFPTASAAHAFSSTSAYSPLNLPSAVSAEDELTYTDVSRQLTLILNVLVSIVCCAAALWWVAKWWSTPARLALSMSGSLLVAVAEVVVYSGYIRRVGEAKQKERALQEVREVARTWVVGRGGDEVSLDEKEVGKKGDTIIVGSEKEKAVRERKKRKGDR